MKVQSLALTIKTQKHIKSYNKDTTNKIRQMTYILNNIHREREERKKENL